MNRIHVSIRLCSTWFQQMVANSGQCEFSQESGFLKLLTMLERHLPAKQAEDLWLQRLQGTSLMPLHGSAGASSCFRPDTRELHAGPSWVFVINLEE